MSKAVNVSGPSCLADVDKEGKYLTFALANEEYGLEIPKDREIIG